MAAGTPGVGPDDVDDLIQSTLVNVMSRLKADGEIVNLEAYARTAARRAFYAHVRQSKMVVLLEPPPDKRVPVTEPWLERMAKALEPSPSELALGDLDRSRYAEQIRLALEALPDSEREVLILRHGVGLSAEDVAACTGYKNATTVDSVAARARRRLEVHLSPSLLGWAQGQGRPRPSSPA